MNRRHFLLAAFLALAASALPAIAAETVLYDKASRYNEIVVTENDGLRTLRFEKGGARQSVVKPGDPDYLELAYTRVALAGLAFCGDEPRRVLVVGVGGGTLPAFLRKHYPDAVIDAVDIDPDVVAVAKQFFGFREDERMHAHVGDGRAFIEKAAAPYDAIFLDAFGTASVPAHLTTIEFLKAVSKALTPGGVVIGNIWDRYSNPQYDSMTRTYREAFAQVVILDVRDSGNKIVIALPRRDAVDRNAAVALGRRLSASRGFPFDAGEFIDYGYQRPDSNAEPGRVLTDANPK
jgi:spermidine synthase